MKNIAKYPNSNPFDGFYFAPLVAIFDGLKLDI